MPNLPALVAVFLLFTATATAGETPLRFGMPSLGSPDAVRRMWTPLLDDLSRALDRPVKGEVFDDYAGVIWGLREGRLDAAWLGNKGAIEAVDRAGAEVCARVVNKNGVEGYYAHLIARRDSPFENVDQALTQGKTLTFGNGDPNSTSGFLIPSYYVFAARGLAPDEAFLRVTRGGHARNFLAVADGEADLATGNSASMERFSRRYPEKFAKVKVIWTSPLIPSDPILLKKDLPASLKQAVVLFLTEYGRETGKTPERLAHEKSVLAEMDWFGFKVSDDSQLAPIRKLILYKELMRARREDGGDETARKTRIKAIEKSLRALEDGA